MRYTRHQIEDEYNRAAAKRAEYAKVKWASHDSMMNRFRLALRELPFDRVGSWLDVGCGTGAFQAEVRARFPHVRGTAIDLSARLLAYARKRPDTAGTDFVEGDFMEFDGRAFDLITCIGVLQKTTFTPDAFFVQAARMLARGGLVHVDTKHLGWRRFRRAGFKPDPSHEWFTTDELVQGAVRAGLAVKRLGGFLPAQSRVVAPQESHTVFLIAEKCDA